MTAGRCVALLALSLVCTACSRSDFQWPRGYVSNVEVVAVYPLHADWNDYVLNDQGDVSCTPATRGPGGPANCVHGGEARRAVVQKLEDCSLYAITDDLGVWSWGCADHGGAGPLELYTAGFAPGRGLRDLLDAGGFKANALRVTELATATVVAASKPAVWGWGNPVVGLPVNATGSAATLTDSGTIYVLDGSRGSNGYVIDADRVAVVTLAGAALTWAGGGPSCIAAGESAAPDHTSMLCVGANHFAWLEVEVRGTSALSRHIDLVGSAFSRIHATTVDNGNDDAIVIADTQSSLVTYLTTRSAGGNGLHLSGSSFNTISDLSVEGSGSTGVLLSDGSSWNLLQRLEVVGAGDADDENGIDVSGATTGFNTLADVRVADAAGYGITVSAMAHDNWILRFDSHANTRHQPSAGVALLGPRNKLVDGRVSNNADMGVRVFNYGGLNAYDNTVVDVLSASVDGTAFIFQTDSSRLTALNLTGVLSSGYGTLVNGPDDVLLANLLVVAHAHGLDISKENDSVHDARFVDVMSVDNDLVSAPPPQVIDYDDGSTGIRFDGHLWVGPASTHMCDVFPDRSGDGLVANTCTSSGADGSSAYSGEVSTAVLETGIASAGMFVGKVASGTASQASISGSGWWELGNAWQTWGRDGGVFPAVNQRGRCATGTCRTWDWRLAASDTMARNRHGSFVDGAACPAAAAGSATADDLQQLDYFGGINAVEWSGDALGDDDGVCEPGERCHNRFLLHATESVLDGVGDDDGLCESNETCIFAPNVGAYQGEGDAATRTCVFQNGAVLGVTMHAYPTNGG